MKKILSLILSICAIIALFSGCGGPKLEKTDQYKAVMELSARWSEQTSSGTLIQADFINKTVPGILYDPNITFTGNVATDNSPSMYIGSTPIKILSTVWTINDEKTIWDKELRALVFDGTEYYTSLIDESAIKKDVDITVDGVNYVGFIVIEPGTNVWGPDEISVSLILAHQ